jgi:hypothetical protein
MPDDVLTADAGFDQSAGVVDDFDQTTADSGTPESQGDDSKDTSVVDDLPSGKEFRAVENGRLNPKLKAHLDTLRTTDPAAAKAIQKALFLEDTLRGKFGHADMRQIDTMRETFEQLGGEQGIQEVQQELDGWRQFDEQFTAGDPKVLEFITSTPEAKDAFLKIAPSMVDRWAETHPDGYQAYIAQAFMATAQLPQFNIPLTMARIEDYLGAEGVPPRLAELVGTLKNFFGFIGQKASAPVTAPKFAPAAQPNDRSAELDKREQDFTRKEWLGECVRERDAVFEATLKKHLGDNVTPETRAKIAKYYQTNLREQIAKKPNVNATLERYFNSKQKQGYVSYLTGVYKEAVPLALRITLGELGLSKKAGAAPAQAGRPGAPATRVPTGKPAVPGEGFRFVGSKPEFSTVDNTHTTPAMYQAGKAVLKNGQRIQWKKG